MKLTYRAKATTAQGEPVRLAITTSKEGMWIHRLHFGRKELLAFDDRPAVDVVCHKGKTRFVFGADQKPAWWVRVHTNRGTVSALCKTKYDAKSIEKWANDRRRQEETPRIAGRQS